MVQMAGVPVRRGAPLKRKAPLRNKGGGLKRVRLRPVNPERRAKLEARNFGDAARIIRAMPCATCGRPGPSQASHVVARGMGGCKGSSEDLIPQCARCHRELEDHGRKTFEAARRCDLRALAAECRDLVRIVLAIEKNMDQTLDIATRAL